MTAPASTRPGWRWTIRDRIMVPHLALVVALVAGTGLVIARWAGDRARAAAESRGRGIVEALGRSTFPMTEGVLRQLKGLGGAEFALVDASGRIESSTLGETGPVPIVLGEAPGFGRPWRLGGVEYRAALVDRPHESGTVRVAVLLPEPALQAAAREATRGVLGATVLGASLAALTASWIARTLARPLSAILAAVRRIGQGDLRPDGLGLPLDRTDEIGELAEGVAQMAAWLGRLHQERVQAERLSLARRLAAGLAHELRNPLAAARMTIQIHLERHDRGDGDLEAVRIALGELDRMERQVRRFLRVARPEPPGLETVAVGPLLGRAVDVLAASAEHRGIALSASWDEGIPDARVDPDQIGQVLANLLGNALDAAGPGGSVRAHAARSTRGGLTIVVEDDGPGVDPAQIARLFQPFFTTKPEGVGLGLAVSDSLAREHGGSIEHDRADGRTRFRLILPTGFEPDPAEAVGGVARWPT